MTIECYKQGCKHHGVHSGEEGPFCFEKECHYEARYFRNPMEVIHDVSNVMRECASTFRKYEAHHLAKMDIEKAEANRGMANKVEVALMAFSEINFTDTFGCKDSGEKRAVPS